MYQQLRVDLSGWRGDTCDAYRLMRGDQSLHRGEVLGQFWGGNKISRPVAGFRQKSRYRVNIITYKVTILTGLFHVGLLEDNSLDPQGVRLFVIFS